METPVPGPSLPERPPFCLRARMLTPLDAGGTRYEPDAALRVEADGTIGYAGSWAHLRARELSGSSGPIWSGPTGSPKPPDLPDLPELPELLDLPTFDLRPMVLLPGLVDLHVHLPQVPSAGLGAGLDLLTWLDRHIFPLERGFDVPAAEQLVPAVFRAMAAAGTTTALGYGALWPGSLDASFRAAQAHGIRAILGKVMMDRVTYDDAVPRDRILETSLRQSAELCERWHGAGDGLLRYAFTPRFAVSCSADLLRESAALANHYGAYWQTHLSEDRAEIAAVHALFPDAVDYLDVYDRAGGLGPRTILAHAIHLSAREVNRLVESGSRVAHCPASNMFLASGAMPLARYLQAGVVIGLGSDVAAAPELSVFAQMRAGFYTQNARRVSAGDTLPILDPLAWLRLGTLEGARALGLEQAIGSLEAGKEADLIAVDPTLTIPPGGTDDDDPVTLMSRLIFRERAGMVRGAWVRGRRLPAG